MVFCCWPAMAPTATWPACTATIEKSPRRSQHLELIGETLATLEVAEAVWLLDRPVSNSGRLQQLILDNCGDPRAGTGRWSWPSAPDPILIEASDPVASADSIVLDYCGHWFNLGRWTVQQPVPDLLPSIDLACPPEPFPPDGPQTCSANLG